MWRKRALLEPWRTFLRPLARSGSLGRTSTDTHTTPGVESHHCLRPTALARPANVLFAHHYRAAVRAKKAFSATGPDSVSREDLLQMPEPILNSLLLILHRAEQTGVWPTKPLAGHVHSLAKTPQASSVNHYRPVTPFSLVYRTYSSIRARQVIRFLAQNADPSAYGCLPGRSATDQWRLIQDVVEQAYEQQQPASGVVADVVKCFNELPRMPLLEIGLHQLSTVGLWGFDHNAQTLSCQGLHWPKPAIHNRLC